VSPPEWRLGGSTPDPERVRPDVPWLPPAPETIECRLGEGSEIMVWRPARTQETVWRPAGNGEAAAPEWRLRRRPPSSDGVTS